MAIDTRIDEARRRAYLRIVGDITGGEVNAVLKALVEARPELAGFDYLYDVREHTGLVVNSDVAEVGDLFERARRPEPDAAPAWTVFVSNDPNLHQWARLMDFQVAGRRHMVFARPEDGEAYLDRLRSAA
ncbi:MAG TPA: hypothetical protein VGB49_04385 [Caulobacteraceae bacterium]|jgi:hypothetical protein